MSDIQKEIKETLNLASQDFDKGAYVHAYEKIEEHAYTWLLHQQELIEQLQLKLDEGVGLVAEGMVLVESMGKVIEQKDAEIARLTEQRNQTLAEWGKTLDDAEILAAQLEKEGM